MLLRGLKFYLIWVSAFWIKICRPSKQRIAPLGSVNINNKPEIEPHRQQMQQPFECSVVHCIGNKRGKYPFCIHLKVFSYLANWPMILHFKFCVCLSLGCFFFTHFLLQAGGRCHRLPVYGLQWQFLYILLCEKLTSQYRFPAVYLLFTWMVTRAHKSNNRVLYDLERQPQSRVTRGAICQPERIFAKVLRFHGSGYG